MAFPDPTLDQWAALATKALKGESPATLDRLTADGLRLPALGTAGDGEALAVARAASLVERPWDIRALVDVDQPDAARAAVLGELEGGAASILLSIDPQGGRGLAGADADTLGRALDGVALEMAPVALDAGLHGPQAANALAVLAKGATGALLAFHLDPLSAFAEAGRSPGPIESHLISAAQTAARHASAYPKASLFLASGRTAHEAGGSQAQELGFMDSAALAYAKANIDAWTAEMAKGLDAILITTSGCGTTIKDYGFMLRGDPAYAQKAAAVSAIAKDISEYLETLPALPVTVETGQSVTYHAACSLQHGQQIKTAPKTLLKQAGFVVKEAAEAHLCCGSAGTYNMLQPEISERLRERKLGNIAATRPQIIAAGNIGCMTQLAQGTTTPIVHTVELLDWATGGPKPRGL